jgi:hypothetical protein
MEAQVPHRKATSVEVQEAIDQRDGLLMDAIEAVKKVDEIKDDLLREYAEAERKRNGGH